MGALGSPLAMRSVLAPRSVGNALVAVGADAATRPKVVDRRRPGAAGGGNRQSVGDCGSTGGLIGGLLGGAGGGKVPEPYYGDGNRRYDIGLTATVATIGCAGYRRWLLPHDNLGQLTHLWLVISGSATSITLLRRLNPLPLMTQRRLMVRPLQ